jgi:hypothetical protein
MSPELAVGAALAVASLAYVLYPLVARRRIGSRPARRGGTTPSAAPPLRDVTDAEIESAIRSYRASHSTGRVCPVCGPRPESDALYCSSCGQVLVGEAGA